MNRALGTVSACSLAALLLGSACSSSDPGSPDASEPLGEGSSALSTPTPIVFNSEDNRFNAYDSATGQKETVIHRALDGGLDINAQICFHQFDGKTYFIAGEDTGQKAAPGEPEPEGSPGWGWFELVGSSVGSLTATQHGKLVPTWSPGLTEQAENYGCGFLPDGRLVTTDVGNQLPHTPASGQLVLWFPDPTKGFDDTTHVALTSEGKVPRGFDVTSDIDNDLDANYCKIDTQIATAGGSWVHSGWVYVAANRPGPAGPGGIYRYKIADFPKDATCSTYPYVSYDNQTDLVAAGAVTRELWLASDVHVETPSALVPSGRSYLGFPTWYVSSVFTGVVAEYADLGHTRVWVRNVVEPPGGLPVGQADDLPLNTKGTPFGLGVAPNGDLWYADMGIVGDGPAAGEGSVQRVRFDTMGNPVEHEIVDDGLLYPDGIGVASFGAAPFKEEAPNRIVDLARGQPVTCRLGSPGAALFDGDDETAVKSSYVYNEYPEFECTVDLGQVASLAGFRVRWGDYRYQPPRLIDFDPCAESHAGVDLYEISVSSDGTNFTKVANSSGIYVTEETLDKAAADARYVKLWGRNSVKCAYNEVGAYTFSVFGTMSDVP